MVPVRLISPLSGTLRSGQLEAGEKIHYSYCILFMDHIKHTRMKVMVT